MLASSTKSRLSPSRAPRTSQTPPVSYPLAPAPASQATPLSPPVTPPRGRRPSLSNTMHWLSRTSTSSSAPYAPSKPTRISEQKLVRSIELITNARSGALGSGATVVRTPDEALRETRVRLTFDGKTRDDARSQSPGDVKSINSITSDIARCATSGEMASISPVASPPLPPLPMPEEEECDVLDTEPIPEPEPPKQPPRPTRAPPPAPYQSLRPSLRLKPGPVVEVDHVPPLPSNIAPTPVPPAFRPILVSEVPTGVVDPSKVIITLETSTVTHKTTLDTLRSRPCHLSKYLSYLFPSPRVSSASSVYSTTSDDMSTYRHHLTSRGLLPQTSFNVHIFLDRPSTPYTHILNYLRSPVGSPEAPETLPRSVQMQPSSHLRLDTLLELRDEAAYLNLEDLRRLCADEIRMRHGPRLHTRGQSSSSTIGTQHSLHASVYSLHALLERVESDIRSNPRDSDTSDSKSTKSSPNLGATRSLPTPESWSHPTRRTASPRRSPPPAGWI